MTSVLWIPSLFVLFFSAYYKLVAEKWEYHGRNGLLAGVVVGGGIVPDHLSILDVHTPTNTVDLRTHSI